MSCARWLTGWDRGERWHTIGIGDHMGRFFILVAILLPLSIAAQRSRHVTTIVPPAVEQKFVLEYPDAQAQWQSEGRNFKAKFINPVNNLGYIQVYDQQGNVLRRERELEPAEVPPRVSEFLVKNSRGQGFVVWTVTDSAGKQSFYSPRPEGTVVFDKTGLPLSEVKLLRDSAAPAPAPQRDEDPGVR